MKLLLTALLLSLTTFISAESKKIIELADGSELSYYHFPAKGQQVFIWLAPEAGLQQSEKEIAKKVAKQGVEVWYPDLFESNFLPIAASSVEQFPPNQIKSLISAVNTGKDIYLVTSGRGVIPMLRGLRQWQKGQPNNTAIKGLILLSPKFFVETPDPGEAAHIMPIVRATNIPIYLFQPTQSPWRWKLDKTLPALRQGGSKIFTQIIPNVRDRFYYRPDATPEEYQVASQLPVLLKRASNVLATMPAKHKAAPLVENTKASVGASKKDRVLTPYFKKPIAPPLQLKDLNGKLINLADFKGEVVMVNFWASWCPPCVFEMPSMQRLQDSLKDKPFRILAVNMAEDKATINKFLKEKVSVDFTILLDSDGAALKRWEVFAFPTTYFIDKQGRLRYGLFGGREWDKADVTKVIDKLMKE
ncbi:MAG: TlpA family protein disulfide reductase [Sulfuriflexus sp.]|nr:TlpA family protein disulfide reductase [Sulfuriflexus sp.]